MSVIDEIFALIKVNDEGYSESFTTEKDLDNIASMQHWLDENDLGDNVLEDDGTLVVLEHPEYDFQVCVTSYGLGDFYTHGIDVCRAEE